MAQGIRKTLFQFGYRRSGDQDRKSPARHPVVVVGAGPVGLAAAIDLAQRGVPVVLLDDADRIGEGSRGICYAKRTLEILDRLGAGNACVEKGVTWRHGKVFQGNDLLYAFDLLPEDGHKRPAFINLQQYHLERVLVDRAADLANLDLRWRNEVVGVTTLEDGVRLAVETPDGPYSLEADWVVAADGARSPLRTMLGLDFVGEAFEERFLIADVKMTAPFPTERWFWFDPPFHPGRSALLHKQPDDVWRIDLGLGPDADSEAEQRPERVIPRIQHMLGHGDFSLEWVSVYRFQCRRLARFVHGRVVFAGDCAHQVSPFGARGANSGVQDAENLAWKLAAVIAGRAPESLIETYHDERSAAADENIAHSTRSTDFIAPRTPQERRWRDATLALAREALFATRMVNSGRLSTPTTHAGSPLSTLDRDGWGGTAALGAPLPDAPLRKPGGGATWLLDVLGGDASLIVFPGATPLAAPNGVRTILVGRDMFDDEGVLAERLDAGAGAAYLVRPDQHLAARWREPDAGSVALAARRMMGCDADGAGR